MCVCFGGSSSLASVVLGLLVAVDAQGAPALNPAVREARGAYETLGKTMHAVEIAKHGRRARVDATRLGASAGAESARAGVGMVRPI
jgi:hypothetical protein